MAETTRHHPIILARARELRQPLTPSETKVWAHTRNNLLGFKIRRQHPINRFIVDFFCAEAQLVIEVDGDSHAEPNQIEYDAARTAWLESQGYAVIRFTNHDVRKRLPEVLRAIYRACELRGSTLTPGPGPSP